MLSKRPKCYPVIAETPHNAPHPINLILIIPAMLRMTFDLHDLRRSLVIYHKCCQLVPADASTVQPECELLQIQSSLSVMSVYDAHALM